MSVFYARIFYNAPIIMGTYLYIDMGPGPRDKDKIKAAIKNDIQKVNENSQFVCVILHVCCKCTVIVHAVM